jgi:hypothetical protein
VAVKAINLQQLLVMLSDCVILRQYFMDSNGNNVVPIIFILWHCMALYGILWHFMAFYGILWHFMALYGILWHFMAFYGIKNTFLPLFVKCYASYGLLHLLPL